MARPRKYIQFDGKTIDGLSLHKSTGRYYSLGPDGQREYWGRDKPRAVEDFLRRNNPVPMSNHEASVLLQSEEGLEPWEITPNLINLKQEANPTYGPVPVDWLPPKSQGDQKPKSGKRLSNCIDAWMEIMLDGHANPTDYMMDVKRVWKKFQKAVGNKLVSEIKPDDFATWRSWVTKEQAKNNRSAKWHNDHHKYIKTVVRNVKIERPSWKFPDGVIEWQELPKRIKMKNSYVPKSSNKQPIPVDIFHQVIAIAYTWTQEQLDFDTKTQSGRAKKRAALARHHKGWTCSAMFRLAVNCGLDNADVAAITWNHVKNLDGDFPYLNMPRTKIVNRFRNEVDRKIPLLASTVNALIQLKENCQMADTIFRTAHGSPHNKDTIRRQLESAMTEAGLTPKSWTFKHLRNVGGKKRLGITGDERDHFLGHVGATESKWYTGDADEKYLLPLVKKIEHEYFNLS